MKKKVCKKCKIFFDESVCPVCKGNQLATTWRGRVNILNPEKSDIAKKTNLNVKGEYAIKIR